MNKIQLEAVEKSGKLGGKYLETIDKFDLRTLTKEEYLGFLVTVIEDYQAWLGESQLQPKHIPY